MTDAISAARTIIANRLEHDPANPFYAFAAREIARIDHRLAQYQFIDRAFYATLTQGIGLMCARELEPADMPFCDAIYAMLTQFQGIIK